jgi:hypothetical protein
MYSIELSNAIVYTLMICIFSICFIIILIAIQSNLDATYKIEPSMQKIMIVLLVWLFFRFIFNSKMIA